MIELDRVCKNRWRLFYLKMSFGFPGSELLKFYSVLSQTFGDAREGERGEISKGANAPESQCFQNLIGDFFLDVSQRVLEALDRKVSETGQLLARRDEGYSLQVSGGMHRGIRICGYGHADRSLRALNDFTGELVRRAK